MAQQGAESDSTSDVQHDSTAQVDSHDQVIENLRKQFTMQMRILSLLRRTAEGENPVMDLDDYTYIQKTLLTRVIGTSGPDLLRGWYSVTRLKIHQLEACGPEEDWGLVGFIELTRDATECLSYLDKFVTGDATPEDVDYVEDVLASIAHTAGAQPPQQ